MPLLPFPAPAPVINDRRLIFKLIGANFNSTADQALIKSGSFSEYAIDLIDVTNASISMTTAAGGFYSAAAKGGVNIVAAGQSYAALTANDVVLNPSLTAAGQRKMTSATMFLSLTTAQGAAATADIYVWGRIYR